MTGILALLLGLSTVCALLFRRPLRPFDGRRANFRVRRATGPNLGSILLVLSIAGLMLHFAGLAVVQHLPGGLDGVVLAAVALVLGIVVSGGVTRLLVAGFGAVLLVLTVGWSGLGQLLIVAAMLLWLLGATRGYFSR